MVDLPDMLGPVPAVATPGPEVAKIRAASVRSSSATSTRRANAIAFDVREKGRIKREIDPVTGACQFLDGAVLCSDCGNGSCEAGWEDECNCPEDCGVVDVAAVVTVREQLATSVVARSGLIVAEQVEGDGAGPDSAFDVTVKNFGTSSTLRYVTKAFDAPAQAVVVGQREGVLAQLAGMVRNSAGLRKGLVVVLQDFGASTRELWTASSAELRRSAEGGSMDPWLASLGRRAGGSRSR